MVGSSGGTVLARAARYVHALFTLCSIVVTGKRCRGEEPFKVISSVTNEATNSQMRQVSPDACIANRPLAELKHFRDFGFG